ncbi:MAG: Ppx/GppA family phosphatase [Candidatus Latescibacteria bacterium]|nr:Ppx/GppA family phosphatase [Candidatus Latescibacterota bacterium]
MDRIGIIDLGSNSARLMIAQYTPGLAFKVTDEVSRRVRLSEGMATENVLHPAAIDRALDTLQVFQAFCHAQGITRIVPVATAAVRDAANGEEFLARVRAETGLEFRVLTGEEEAYWGTVGVVNSLGLRDGFVIDIGGGSVEISQVQRGDFKRGITTPLGAVRLTETYVHSDPVKSSEVKRLIDHIAAAFEALTWMTLESGEQFAGIGGTIRALVRIDRGMSGYPLGLVHGYELKLSRLDRLIDRLLSLPVHERARKVPGLMADRTDIILAGTMVVAGALRRAGADRLVVCGQGLREGLLYRELLKPADPPLIRNLREFSILNIARLYGYEQAHTKHVAALVLSLFDQLAPVHGYGALEREYLWAAAQLHDIGTVIDYYDHHKHSAYIILNAGLPGYSHRETVLIAQLCLYHRKGKPNPEPYSRLLKDGDVKRINRLAALLRLAEYLDRSRAQTVTDLHVTATGKQVRLRVNARTSAEARVEVWEAQRNAELFEEAFGCKLEIEQA